MLIIRLQRVGKTNQAAFRIVLAEKHRSAKKKALEILGHYDPRTKQFALNDKQRLNYWTAQHVEISPTVHNLLVKQGLLEGKKVQAWKPKKKKVEEPKAETPSPQPSPTGGEGEKNKVDEKK